jgi:acetoin utilization protein AcuB
MLVEDIMTRQVVAIGPEMPIRDVAALMAQRNIRHFPIVEAGALVGIVSDRDLRLVGSAHPDAPPGVTFKDAVALAMRAPVVTAHPKDPIEEAAKVLRARKIGAMPVVDGDETLIGIVTGIDFLDALVRMAGAFGATSRLELELTPDAGALARALQEIAAAGHAVESVLTTKLEPDARVVVLRVGTIDVRSLAARLTERGFAVLWPQEKG